MDYIFPNENEKELLQMAEKIGIKEICLCYETKKELNYEFNGRLELGQIVTEKTRKIFSQYTVLLNPINPRYAFEHSKAQIICNLETQKQGDFLHHRASGLNHIIARIGSERGKKMGINFSTLLNANLPERAKLIGRLKQNLMLSRKAKLEVVIFSGARKPTELRSLSDLNEFLEYLR